MSQYTTTSSQAMQGSEASTSVTNALSDLALSEAGQPDLEATVVEAHRWKPNLMSPRYIDCIKLVAEGLWRKGQMSLASLGVQVAMPN